MLNLNLSHQPTQLQDSQNKITSQVLDFSFIKALPTENEIVLALLERGFKRKRIEAIQKVHKKGSQLLFWLLLVNEKFSPAVASILTATVGGEA